MGKKRGEEANLIFNVSIRKSQIQCHSSIQKGFRALALATDVNKVIRFLDLGENPTEVFSTSKTTRRKKKSRFLQFLKGLLHELGCIITL